LIIVCMRTRKNVLGGEMTWSGPRLLF
jgi:hypothetical protein